MTFTEAAIEVLRREGKPLHFKKIAEIAVRESLLDHVGKIPDDTMADQLVAHCRLPRPERRVIPVQQGTFALAEWGLDEDPLGLDNLIELPPEGELPYRGRERYPVPSRDIARATGRGEGRPRRREEEERRGRRFPPPAEVAYEILAGAAKPLTFVEIAAQGAERLLMPDAFVRDSGSLSAALSEDNRRREGSGRRALFQIDGELVSLIAQPEPGERPAAAATGLAAARPGDLRRASLAALRRRLRECDGPTVEYVVGRMLEKLGYRDLKVAKRGREHAIYTARRRMGLAELRHGIRVVRSGADVGRREVSELRRDLGHYGAQIGVVVSTGEAARESRAEATAAGQLPVVLLCGEALAEALAESGVGCVPVVLPEVDEAFFAAAGEAAGQEETARRGRREERDRRDGERREERREGREGREGRREEARDEPAGSPGGEVVPGEVTASGSEEEREPALADIPTVEVAAQSDDLGPAGPAEEDDGEEGPEGDEEGAEAGAAAGPEAPADQGGERRRRRRRRRRRGGRGRGRGEGTAQGGAAGPGEAAAGAPAGGPAPEAAPREEPPPPPPPAPSGGEGSGS